ncbi:MAG: polyprenyl synthetase family protein [Alloprevotella sp.]|nr:polyprenyl synthetase family protein [Alloprevotella sp.]
MLVEAFLESIEKELSAMVPDEPVGLYSPVHYALGMGGKRMRPILLLLAYSLYRFDWQRVVPVAIALETYHNHTLLHDDVMDRADVRRGKPSVWRKWDENTAILSGDVMLIMAISQLTKYNFPHQAEVLNLCLRTMREICEGQQLDMDFERRNDVSVHEYMEMIRLKTAVLLGCALQSGAMLADAPEAHWSLLYNFGIDLGLAFQLQDDYLDCYGTADLFGKNIGGDIREGKKTYMLITAYEKATATQREQLYKLSQDEVDAEQKVAGVLEIYNQVGIPQVCRAEIERLFNQAQCTLAQLPIEEKAKETLWKYANSLLHRQA